MEGETDHAESARQEQELDQVGTELPHNRYKDLDELFSCGKVGARALQKLRLYGWT